jgi:hypothetical protein
VQSFLRTTVLPITDIFFYGDVQSGKRAWTVDQSPDAAGNAVPNACIHPGLMSPNGTFRTS